MKVILLKDVRRIGSAHEVKDVAEGFARNFLLPQKLAEIATPEKLHQLEAKRAAALEEVRKQEEVLDNKLASLRGKAITIAAKATPKGGLFKSITSKDIARAIREQHSLEVPDAALHMPDHMKTVGEHSIELVGHKVHGDMTLTITATP